MFPTIHTNTRKKFDNSSNDIVGIMALVRLRKFVTFASWLKFCVQVLSMPYHMVVWNETSYSFLVIKTLTKRGRGVFSSPMAAVLVFNPIALFKSHCNRICWLVINIMSFIYFLPIFPRYLLIFQLEMYT